MVELVPTPDLTLVELSLEGFLNPLAYPNEVLALLGEMILKDCISSTLTLAQASSIMEYASPST